MFGSLASQKCQWLVVAALRLIFVVRLPQRMQSGTVSVEVRYEKYQRAQSGGLEKRGAEIENFAGYGS